MKLFITLALITNFSVTAFAKNNPVKETKTKITCYTDSILNKNYEDGRTDQDVTNRKTSESIRTTWSDGTSEYRLSDYKSFASDDLVHSVGKSTTKFSTLTDGKKVTETTQYHSVTRYRDDVSMTGGNLKERKGESVHVYYQVNDNERVLISYLEDGKSEPTHDQREITTKISDTVKSIKYILNTPYIEEHDGLKLEVLKHEMTCQFEILP